MEQEISLVDICCIFISSIDLTLFLGLLQEECSPSRAFQIEQLVLNPLFSYLSSHRIQDDFP